MNLEKFLEVVFNNPNNISIEYSNINGEEKLIVNGEDLSAEEKTFDDGYIKDKVARYKENVSKLSDETFDKVIEEAENRKFNLNEMNRGLELESFSEEDALYANNVIDMMSELIKEVLGREVQRRVDLMERF